MTAQSYTAVLYLLGTGVQKAPWKPKSTDAQVSYIKWPSIINTVGSPNQQVYLYSPNLGYEGPTV